MVVELPGHHKSLAKDCHYNHTHGDLLCLEKDSSNLEGNQPGTTAPCSQLPIKEPDKRLQGRSSSDLITEMSSPGVDRAPVYWQVIKNESSPAEALGKQPPGCSRVKHV